jgi:hypothetical protein
MSGQLQFMNVFLYSHGTFAMVLAKQELIYPLSLMDVLLAFYLQSPIFYRISAIVK